MNRQDGFTLIEMLITMALGLMILSAVIYTFTQQERLLKDQNADSEIRALARYAMGKMAEDLRAAGAGVPALRRFDSADTTEFSFRTISRDSTNNPLEPGTVVSDITSGDTQISLGNVDGLQAGQTVALYDIEDLADTTISGHDISKTINNVNTGAKKVTLSAGVTANYLAYDTMFNPFDVITYTYDAANDRITRTINGTTSTLISNVTAFTFVYKDVNENALAVPVSASNLNVMRKVEIAITVQDPKKSNASIDMNTDIYFRTTGL
ncbi:protein of unknown function [Nitrospina watsonii]|uniref:Prepilin-type N-terminal cleavage/methylation domain-containing protein n=2 Tax=Nitrospina watsonii TaxID=1323948 RepID=A0ABM9HFL4_9BACT|nr:protein of unknown function [Nitrospina watsonii]